MPKTFWSDTLVDNQASSGGAQVNTSLFNQFSIAESRLVSLTLLRTIIGLDIAHLIHDSGEGSQTVELGIGVVSQDAFAAGGGALPSPVVQNDFPTRGWVWRARFRTYGFAADQPAVYNNRVDLDIRARRKLENGVSILSVVNTPDQGTAGTINVIGLIRQLWLQS